MNHTSPIAARMLLDLVKSSAPEGVQTRSFGTLERCVEERQPAPYVTLEFERDNGKHRASVTLYVKLENAEGRFSYGTVKDDDGNVWAAEVYRTEVNYPCHGSCDVATLQFRLALLTEVARFAAEVERTLAGTWHTLVETASERRTREDQRAKNGAKSRIEGIVKSNAKGMKVGQTKRIEAWQHAGGKGEDFLPIGEVEVERHEGGRVLKYRAEVNATKAFYFTRVA